MNVCPTHRGRKFRAIAVAIAGLILLLGACADDWPPPPPLIRPPHCAMPEFFFDLGSIEPRGDAREQMIKYRLGPSTPDYPCRLDASPTTRARILLTGHTDRTGDEAANEQIGMRRAQNIARLLIDLGYAREYICVRSVGSKRPLVANAPSREPLNRRVDLFYQRIEDSDLQCPAGYSVP